MQAKALILLALVAVALADDVTDGTKHVESEKVVKESEPMPHLDDSKKDKRGLLDLGIGYASPYTVVSGPSVVTTGLHTNTIITKEVPVVVPHPVAVPVERPVPVIQKVAVPVDRPVAVPVPKPVAVHVSQTVAAPVPVQFPVVNTHLVSVPYPLVKHVAVSEPLTHSYVVEKHHAPLATTYTVYN